MSKRMVILVTGSLVLSLSLTRMSWTADPPPKTVTPPASAIQPDRPTGDTPKPNPAKIVAPPAITIQGDSIPLSEALAKLSKQTEGVVVEDKRREEGDPKLKLNVKNASFWQALDEIARQADLKIYPYREKIALIDGPYHELPTSYNGIFRATVKRIAAYRDLEADARAYVATLEITWDPRFRPFLIDTRTRNLTVKDDKDRTLPLDDQGGSKVAVESPYAMTVDVRLPAPQRTVGKLNLVKGELSAVLPSKMLEFTFDSLDSLANDPKARSQTKEGITVAIGKPEIVKDRCTLELALTYPADGPEFESFQNWLISNKIYLQNRKGEQLDNASYNTTEEMTRNQAKLTYNFLGGKKTPLDKPADWKLVYRTPGAIVELPMTFEFKDLPLP